MRPGAPPAAAAAARRDGDLAAHERALALFGRELLPEDRYEDWAASRREELHTTYVELLQGQARLLEGTGAIDLAVEALRGLLAQDPANEDAHASLMRLYARRGQRHLAVRQFELLREALRRELDTVPSPAIQALRADILAGRLAAEPTFLTRAEPRPQPRAAPATPRHDRLPVFFDRWRSRTLVLAVVALALAVSGAFAVAAALLPARLDDTGRGALVWRAALDEGSSDVLAQSVRVAPSVGAAAVRSRSAAIDCAVLQSNGFVRFALRRGAETPFFAETDLVREADSDARFLWVFRATYEDGYKLQLENRGGVPMLQLYFDERRLDSIPPPIGSEVARAAPRHVLSPPVVLDAAAAGGKLTLGIAARAHATTVFVNGQRVVEARDSRLALVESTNFVYMCGGPTGTISITGIRVYRLNE